LLASDDKNSVLCEVSQGGRKEIAYSAYGHRADDASVSSHLGYNGELREAQTGWYLLGNGYRAFNPLLMRFHSPDSWSPFGDGGLNAYMYVLGNPIGHTDPTGHMPLSSKLLKSFGNKFDDLARSGREGASASTIGAASARSSDNGGTAVIRASGDSSKPPLPEPKPDYPGARRSSVEGHTYDVPSNPATRPELSPAEKAQRKADRARKAAEAEAKAQARETREITSNRVKYAQEYKEALKRSKPNVIIGKDAHGHNLVTTNVRPGWDSKFGILRHNVGVDVPVKVKRVREYQ
jgi:RHS repeat-associated protein